MAITFTSGLEPVRDTQPSSFRSLTESTRRTIKYLQGNLGRSNPLETYITFPTGIYSVTLISGGSEYLNAPTVAIHPLGSSGGSGATATASLTAGAVNYVVSGITLTDSGSGYLKIPYGSSQTLTSPGISITGVDVRFTFTDDDIDMSTNVITKTAHGMSDTNHVHLTTDNRLPSGLYDTDEIGNVYLNPDFYVINATTDTFQLSKTSGGTAVSMESRSATGTALIGSNVPEGESESNMVVGVNIIDGGRFYVTAPTVTFSAPPEGGTQATGTVSITDGYVDNIEMTENGTGYLEAPTVTFSGGHGTHSVRYGGGATATTDLGSGAIAVPVTDASGVITSISVTAGGSNYVAGTTVSITGKGGSGATATATLNSGAVNNVPVTNGGTGYASLTSLVNRLVSIQTNLGNEINQANSDKIAINAWINGTPPSNWTNAGYTTGDLTNVYNTVHTYSLACVACKVDVDAIITSLNTTAAGTFKEHNEMLCGLRDTRPDPYKKAFHELMVDVTTIESLKNQVGVPYVNYTVKLFGTLFTGDDTIDTTTGHILTTPPWSGTPYDLAAYGVQNIISVGATAPSAIITVIGGFTTSVSAYEVLVTADNAAFTAHVTTDEAELATATAFSTYHFGGQLDKVYWTEDYTKFMYTDVMGSERALEILEDMDNDIIS